MSWTPGFTVPYPNTGDASAPGSDSSTIRRDTSVEWSSTNPVLAAGEPGIAYDTGELAVGDGTTAWNDLPKYQITRSTIESSYSAEDVASNGDIPGTGVSFTSDGISPWWFFAHVGGSRNSTTGGRCRLVIVDDDSDATLWIADSARSSSNATDTGPITVVSPIHVLSAGVHNYKLQNATVGGGQSTLEINAFAPAILRAVPVFV